MAAAGFEAALGKLPAGWGVAAAPNAAAAYASLDVGQTGAVPFDGVCGWALSRVVAQLRDEGAPDGAAAAAAGAAAAAAASAAHPVLRVRAVIWAVRRPVR